MGSMTTRPLSVNRFGPTRTKCQTYASASTREPGLCFLSKSTLWPGVGNSMLGQRRE